MKKYITVTLAIFLVGCASFFENDFADLRLPRYSAWGANVSAALNNNTLWLSEAQVIPNYRRFQIYSFPDSLVFMFLGNWENEEIQNDSIVTLLFSLPISNIEQVEDLEDIELRSYDLANEAKISVKVLSRNEWYVKPNFKHAENGQFHLRHVKRNDRENVNYAFAGTFGFDFTENGVDLSHHFGRFDWIVRADFFIATDSLFTNEFLTKF